MVGPGELMVGPGELMVGLGLATPLVFSANGIM